MGGYVKRCSGIHVYFKIENPKGKRIHDFFINGKRLEKTRRYQTSFITIQGVPRKYGSHRRDLTVRTIEVLTEYLEKNSPITPVYEHRVVPI
jgi:hypothetical protein